MDLGERIERTVFARGTIEEVADVDGALFPCPACRVDRAYRVVLIRETSGVLAKFFPKHNAHIVDRRVECRTCGRRFEGTVEDRPSYVGRRFVGEAAVAVVVDFIRVSGVDGVALWDAAAFLRTQGVDLRPIDLADRAKLPITEEDSALLRTLGADDAAWLGGQLQSFVQKAADPIAGQVRVDALLRGEAPSS